MADATDNEYRRWLARNGIDGLSECDRYGMDEKGNDDDE